MKTIKKYNCDPEEIAVKSYFLGPKAENEYWLKKNIHEFLEEWFKWRKNLFKNDKKLISAEDQKIKNFKEQQKLTTQIVREISKKFRQEIPKFSPRYIGHMFSEISLPALLGHMITLLHNPNNISPEASNVGIKIEAEAVSLLGKLMGFAQSYGHFTSGGTIANFEFLIRAKERLSLWLATSVVNGERSLLRGSALGWSKYNNLVTKENLKKIEKLKIYNDPSSSRANLHDLLGKKINEPVLLVSSSKHYSWPKAMHNLGLGLSQIRYIKLDSEGRLSVEHLKETIQNCIKEDIPILGVVAIVGSTELGTVDPIAEIVELLLFFKKKYGLHFWLHLDGAYGGFFRSIINDFNIKKFEPYLVRQLEAISSADSITLDPHKLGYVPYSSGTFLCQNKENYYLNSFMGPYIKNKEVNIGNYTIEGSRSAAGAVATYASIKAFKTSNGYARVLSRTMQARKKFESEIGKIRDKIFFAPGRDTNIICFGVVGNKNKLTDINKLNLKIYEKIQKSKIFWISKTTLNKSSYESLIEKIGQEHAITIDSQEMVLLRLTLMNPFIISKESALDYALEFGALLEKFAELK